jgi:hypothetical protein
MEAARAMQRSFPGRLADLALSNVKKTVKPHRWYKFKEMPVLSDIYTAAFDIAWTLDEAVRMGTARTLHDMGYSVREAAQMAAKAHSDYASVPPKVRRALNNIFFTPTFKITMGKFYGRMMADAVKSLGDPKSVITMRKTRSGKYVKPRLSISGRYAFGLASLAAILHSTDMFFRGLGFERDEWGRRYIRRIKDEKGKTKELVITWSSPANMFLKYGYRMAAAAASNNPVGRFFTTNRWEMTPVLRVAYDIATGKDPKGNIIYDWKLDGEVESGKKIMWYTTKELLAILGAFDPEKTDKEGRELFAQETSKLLELALRPFTFKYTRKPEEVRIAGKMKGFAKHFRSFMFNKLRHKKKWTPENVENFKKEMNRLREEIKTIRDKKKQTNK